MNPRRAYLLSIITLAWEPVFENMNFYTALNHSSVRVKIQFHDTCQMYTNAKCELPNMTQSSDKELTPPTLNIF